MKEKPDRSSGPDQGGAGLNAASALIRDIEELKALERSWSDSAKDRARDSAVSHAASFSTEMPSAAELEALTNKLKEVGAAKPYQFVPSWVAEVLAALPDPVLAALARALRPPEPTPDSAELDLANARSSWLGEVDRLAARLFTLPLTDRDEAEAFLLREWCRARLRGPQTISLDMARAKALPDVEDVLREVAWMGFSVLEAQASVRDEAVPHLRADHHWHEGIDTDYVKDVLFVFRVAEREFLYAHFYGVGTNF